MERYIYSSDPGLTIGFHGCEADLSNKVINGNTTLRSSKNSWDWHGDGIYFWQNNYDRAWDYAKNPPKGVKINTPGVIGAVFNLGNCLDLTDKKWLDLVKYSYDTVEKSFAKVGKKMPVNLNPIDDPTSKDRIIRKLDCAVIKNIHAEIESNKLPPFDSVRGVFFEGNLLYHSAGFHEKTHLQVCIRNPNCIKGYFLPRKEVNW
ncbi:hypothetical protein [Chitinophaga sp. sic0106]|uniref:hypothetical protein n=1 Tax=Chitinophaga sp. sic0106 TaxID=2854785 RepID=UPI001C454DF3|nr:hypothetical protein [Chitinophaga sp. sic0106]MBV7533215.1 hypothetical protein [Chitinophaga sp. sic0106]